MFCFDRCPFDDEEIESITSKDQIRTEDLVHKTYQVWRDRYTYQQKQDHDPTSVHPLQPPPDLRILYREKHMAWLLQCIRNPPDRVSFAVIHPWLVFWIIQSLALLDTSPILTPEQRQEQLLQQQQDDDLPSSPTPTSPNTIKFTTPNATPNPTTTIWTREFGLELIAFMKRFEHQDGGYAGHFGGDAHVITTYAATMAIVIVGTRCGVYDEAYKSIDVPKMIQFIKSLKITNRDDENYGTYHTCLDGEADTRSVFAAITVLDILGELPNPELTDGVAEWLARCQNYDGGFSCEPGVESHGGYTLTALASLVVLEATDKINLDLLEKWCVERQMEREGGFCGRTHKLVDSCYSFWVGSAISLVQVARQQILDLHQGKSLPTLNFATEEAMIKYEECPPHPHGSSCPDEVILPPPQLGWMFDQQALQCYLLICCQHQPVGFKDKPGMAPDFYHTCYSLSGLSTAQTSVPFQKLSYSYINQGDGNGVVGSGPSSTTTTSSSSPSSSPLPPQQPLQSPTTSQQSPILTDMYKQVNNLPQSTTSNNDSLEPQALTPAGSGAGENMIRKLPQETLDLIEKYKHPTIYRFGGNQAKLQPNNIIFNIPQGCYVIAHGYNQCRKLKQQQQQQQQP